MTAAETPRSVERATLSEPEWTRLWLALRNGVSRMGSAAEEFERILTDRLAAAVARAEAAEAKAAAVRVEAVLEFIQYIASNAAYNGAPGVGQNFYNDGLNTWLDARGFEYLTTKETDRG